MKFVLWIVIPVFLLVISVVPLATLGAKQAFAHPEKPWAPGVAVTSAQAMTYATVYSGALEILLKANQTFPAYPRRDRVYFLIGYCYEKDCKYPEARQWYNAFLQAFPGHEWTGKIQKRMADLEAVGN